MKELEQKILKLYKKIKEYGLKNRFVANDISTYCRETFNKYNLWKLTYKIPISYDIGKETVSYGFTDEMIKVLNRGSKFNENLQKAKKYNKILENYYELVNIASKDYISKFGKDKYLNELRPKICKVMGWN